MAAIEMQGATSTSPTPQKSALNVNQLNQERHVKNRIFGCREHNPCEAIMFFFFKVITLGLSELLFVNQITRYEVRKMRIGNRRLNYDTSDGFEIILKCLWNNLLNYLTLGLWYISGQMTQHYYAHLDERIHWAEEVKPRKPTSEEKMEASGSFPNLDEFIVWQPENDCRGVIVYYGVHLGWQKELLYVLMKTCAILTFGFLMPFVHQYYNPKFLEEVRYGRGQFVVIPPQVASQLMERTKETIINYNVQYSSQYPVLGQPLSSPAEMRFIWTADATDMFCRYFLGAIINNFTFGFFRCCYWYWWVFNFYNDHSFITLDGKSNF